MNRIVRPAGIMRDRHMRRNHVWQYAEHAKRITCRHAVADPAAEIESAVDAAGAIGILTFRERSADLIRAQHYAHSLGFDGSVDNARVAAGEHAGGNPELRIARTSP